MKDPAVKVKDLILPYDSFELSPNTLQNRINEALLGLIRNWTEYCEPLGKDIKYSLEDYKCLRASVKFRLTDQGLRAVISKTNLLVVVSPESQVKRDDRPWNDKLNDFIANAQEGEVLEIKHQLTVEDMKEITAKLDKTNFTYEFNETGLIVIR